MKKQLILGASLALSAVGLFALTPKQILKKVDSHEYRESSRFVATMKIKRHGRIRTKKMRIYGKGRDYGLAIVLSGPEKGQKFLKVKDSLKIYFPDAEGIQHISGHMLKQSMLGSDYSYEDSLETEKLHKVYTAKIVKEEKMEGEDCWLMDLRASSKRAPYAQQKMWISKKYFIPMKTEMYASSGRLLKVETVFEGSIKNVQGRNVATKVKLEDKMRRGSYTIFMMDQVRFGVKYPSGFFTERNLRRIQVK